MAGIWHLAPLNLRTKTVTLQLALLLPAGGGGWGFSGGQRLPSSAQCRPSTSQHLAQSRQSLLTDLLPSCSPAPPGGVSDSGPWPRQTGNHTCSFQLLPIHRKWSQCRRDPATLPAGYTGNGVSQKTNFSSSHLKSAFETPHFWLGLALTQGAESAARKDM